MIKPSILLEIGREKTEENMAFRQWLKGHVEDEVMDHEFNKLHHQLLATYDCNHCRNCCKIYGAEFGAEDLERGAGKMTMGLSAFIHEYLEFSSGAYVSKDVPCSFLMSDGQCQLGDHQPMGCHLFPYTDQDDRRGHLINMVGIAEICPPVHEMFELLKDKYNFKTR